MGYDSNVTTRVLDDLSIAPRNAAQKRDPIPAEDAPVVAQRELNATRGRELQRRTWGK